MAEVAICNLHTLASALANFVVVGTSMLAEHLKLVGGKYPEEMQGCFDMFSKLSHPRAPKVRIEKNAV